MEKIAIRPEAPADVVAVDELYRRAFDGYGTVLDLLRALRVAPANLGPVSLAAASPDGRVFGHVLLSAARLDAPPRLVDVLTLSSLAVDPPHQRRGIGTALIAAALTEAEGLGVPLVFLEGAADYYGARGFVRASTLGFRSPSLRIPDAAFQVARLAAYEPWMTGSFVYSETFWALDCVGLR